MNTRDVQTRTRGAFLATTFVAALVVGGCTTASNDGITPGRPIPLGTIEGTFLMRGSPIKPTGGIVTLVPLTGDGTVYQLHVSASGAFQMQLPPARWSVYGREVFGRHSGPAGCGGTQVRIKTDKTAVANFRCDGT